MDPKTPGRAIVIAVALTMLLVPLQASATHNSFGTRMEITQGDEVDPETGNLAPDVPDEGHVDEKANVYMRNFANQHDQIPAREGPDDQSGAFYDAENECRGYDEFSDEAQASPSDFDQKDHYEDALPNHNVPGITEVNDACWVGYLDKQNEYVFTVTAIGQSSSDTLYWLNPSTADPDCQHGDYFISLVEDVQPGEDGQERRQGCGSPNDVPVVDTPLPDSSTSHEAWMPGSWHSGAIDTDLVEGPLGGDDGTNCQEATCGIVDPTEAGEHDGRDYHGSGTLTLPLEYTRTTFLFGYAHPDNEASDEYDINPDDPAFSQPLWGVPNEACGDRIPDGDCQLLGPEDLKLYDVTHDEGLEEDERGRLCSFNPDSSIANPAGLQGGPCGLFGTEVTTFIEDTNAGGFGTNAVQTYQSTFPGWKNPLLTLYHNGFTSAWCGPQMFGSENTTGQLYGDGHEDYEETRPGEDCSTAGEPWAFKYFDRGLTAVNPAVPQVEDQVSCMRPQIKGSMSVVPGSGDEGEPIAAQDLYGDYRAAAIDVDMYVGGSTSVYAGNAHSGAGVPGYEGYHETFGDVVDPVDQAAGTVFGVAEDTLDQASNATDEVQDRIPDDTPGQEQINQVLDTAGEASERAGPSETSDEEPSNQLGPDNWDYRELAVPEGISCQAGVPQFNEEPGTKGVGLQFDNTVSRETVWLKDPTIFDGDLPARENETTDGTWQTDSYDFGTPLLAYADENLDGNFSGCAPNDGAPAPNQDSCPWTATWDAYNPDCTGSEDEQTCGELLLEDDYVLYEENVTTDRPFGVGAVATLEVSGTTLLHTGTNVDAVNDWRVVNQDPAQSTCVIMTSQDFSDKLSTHVGDTGTTDQTFDTDEENALCPDHDSENIEVWHDAFEGQGGPNDGGLTSTVSWAKITPTPDAVRESMDMADDRLCLSFVFSTDSKLKATNTDNPGVNGTKDNIQLGADSTTTYYTDCDVLTSHEDPEGEPTDDHPLDGKTFTFPDYSESHEVYSG